MAHGDRWSDDPDDRIEWHVSRMRVWVMVGVLVLVAYIIGDVLARVF